MHRTQLIGATLLLALLAPAGRDVRATGSTADIVFEWNQILQDTVPAPHGVLTPRFFAMTHIAMFDAINTIEREFEPYRVRLRHWGGGSPEAAAAQAAHDVLVVINPAATATYDAALARQLGTKPSGFVRRGAALGARVAKEILEWRQNDGWVVSPFPAVFRAAAAGTLAADPAEQSDRGIHASSERRADGPADGHAVPAATAAIADQRALRRGPERGEAHRKIGQRDPHGRADLDRAAVGGHRDDGHRHGHQLHVDLEQHRSRRGAGAPAVARRDRSRVRARERVGARRPADDPGEQVRLRALASRHGHPSGRHAISIPRPIRIRPGCRCSRRPRIRHTPATWRRSARAPRARSSSRSARTTFP